MQKILPYILASIKRHNRQKVIAGMDFHWSKTNWTHNIFRAFELVFWRKEGIARSAWSGIYFEEGKPISVHQFYTVEAFLAHMEGQLRAFLKTFRLPKVHKVYLPQLAPVGGYSVLPQGRAYVFAIAFDAIDPGLFDNSGSATTFTLAHTCTGSNLALVVPAVIIHPFTQTSMTYNSSAMTLSASNTSANTNEYDTYFYTKINPSTGTNNIVWTIPSPIGGTSHQMTMEGTSYTGCNQTTLVDSSNIVFNTVSASPASVSTTVVASNCWLTGFAADANGNTYSAGTGTTCHAAQNHNYRAGDSNGTVSTGSQSLNWACTSTGDTQTRGVMSIIPAASAVNSGFFFAAAR